MVSRVPGGGGEPQQESTSLCCRLAELSAGATHTDPAPLCLWILCQPGFAEVSAVNIYMPHLAAFRSPDGEHGDEIWKKKTAVTAWPCRPCRQGRLWDFCVFLFAENKRQLDRELLLGPVSYLTPQCSLFTAANLHREEGGCHSNNTKRFSSFFPFVFQERKIPFVHEVNVHIEKCKTDIVLFLVFPQILLSNC